MSRKPVASKTRFAVESVKAESVAPPALFCSPNVAMPDRRYSSEPEVVMIRTRSPMAKPSSSAVFLSITTSSAARGGAPAAIFSGFSCGSSDQEKPSAGGPEMPAGLPSLPMIWAVPPTVPSAVATPSTPRTTGSRSKGTG